MRTKKKHGSCKRCGSAMRGTQAGTIRCEAGCRPEQKKPKNIEFPPILS